VSPAQEKEFKEAYPDAAGQGLSKKYAPALELTLNVNELIRMETKQSKICKLAAC
jgi:hypothetical protein